MAKLDVLFSGWVEAARKNPLEGHKANLRGGAVLLYFTTSKRLEVWREGEAPQRGQVTFGAFVQEAMTFEQYATEAGLTLSGRRMQLGSGKYCMRWDANLTQARAL